MKSIKGLTCILHIPHSSSIVPEAYRNELVLNDDLLKKELLVMTDHFTHELYSIGEIETTRIVFPVSRLIVDVERFPKDIDEPMSQRGMGAVYLKTHDGKQLRGGSFNLAMRENLMTEFYYPHHQSFEDIVTSNLEHSNQVVIIDCHSFPSLPLPCDIDQDIDRPDICIGTDPFHTPENLIQLTKQFWIAQGFSVGINMPFAGTMVPMKYFEKEKRVLSLMIEIRRDLYVNEKTGLKNSNFELMANHCKNLIKKITANY